MKKVSDEPHATIKRCNAKTRQGSPCKAYSMTNGRCRMHGGKSTGPKTKEGLERSKIANYKHGKYSKQHLKLKKDLNDLINILKPK